jgi:1-aminocyclopropane-1-carboxylate deaminase/D-cysteine desulfhydrase-like pyridoxal-dependent ACC family enzyme
MAKITVERLREAISTLPRVKLVYLPTPLEDCPRFSEALSGTHILVKRDELTGLAFGGNKSRKHEFIFGEAKAQGADCMIHGAASQSNYSRQLTAACAKMGMKAYLTPQRDQRSEVVGIQGNLLLDVIMGADITLVKAKGGKSQGQVQLEIAEELRRKGHKPYIVGHYDSVLGTVAYAECGLEIYEQLEALGLKADYICMASGSGTQAGVALASIALGAGWKIMGFRPGPGGDNAAVSANIAKLANEAAELLKLDVVVEPEDVPNTDAYAGKAYGIINHAGCEAIELLARTEGIILDPVYVGKAMSGVIDYIRTGKIQKNQTVVFLHTGGTPALFAYNKEIVDEMGYSVKIVGE